MTTINKSSQESSDQSAKNEFALLIENKLQFFSQQLQSSCFDEVLSSLSSMEISFSLWKFGFQLILLDSDTIFGMCLGDDKTDDEIVDALYQLIAQSRFDSQSSFEQFKTKFMHDLNLIKPTGNVRWKFLKDSEFNGSKVEEFYFLLNFIFGHENESFGHLLSYFKLQHMLYDLIQNLFQSLYSSGVDAADNIDSYRSFLEQKFVLSLNSNSQSFTCVILEKLKLFKSWSVSLIKNRGESSSADLSSFSSQNFHSVPLYNAYSDAWNYLNRVRYEELNTSTFIDVSKVQAFNVAALMYQQRILLIRILALVYWNVLLISHPSQGSVKNDSSRNKFQVSELFEYLVDLVKSLDSSYKPNESSFGTRNSFSSLEQEDPFIAKLVSHEPGLLGLMVSWAAQLEYCVDELIAIFSGNRTAFDDSDHEYLGVLKNGFDLLFGTHKRLLEHVEIPSSPEAGLSGALGLLWIVTAKNFVERLIVAVPAILSGANSGLLRSFISEWIEDKLGGWNFLASLSHHRSTTSAPGSPISARRPSLGNHGGLLSSSVMDQQTFISSFHNQNKFEEQILDKFVEAGGILWLKQISSGIVSSIFVSQSTEDKEDLDSAKRVQKKFSRNGRSGSIPLMTSQLRVSPLTSYAPTYLINCSARQGCGSIFTYGKSDWFRVLARDQFDKFLKLIFCGMFDFTESGINASSSLNLSSSSNSTFISGFKLGDYLRKLKMNDEKSMAMYLQQQQANDSNEPSQAQDETGSNAGSYNPTASGLGGTATHGKRLYRSQIHGTRNTSMIDISGGLVHSRGSSSFAINRGSTTVVPRNDTLHLLRLMILIYLDNPDPGSIILEPRRRTTLKMLYDDRLSSEAKMAYFQVLSVLGNTPKSAKFVHDMLATGSGNISWDWIVSGLNWYIEQFRLAQSSEVSGHGLGVSTQEKSPEMSDTDMELLQSLIKLVEVVCWHCTYARINLSGPFSVLMKLFELLSCRLPKELKASAMESIRAFGIKDDQGPSHDELSNYQVTQAGYHSNQPVDFSNQSAFGNQGYHVSPLQLSDQIWHYMEQIKLVPSIMDSVHTGYDFPFKKTGILADLEQVESQDWEYPETISFLKLLSCLLYPHSRSPSYNVPVVFLEYSLAEESLVSECFGQLSLDLSKSLLLPDSKNGGESKLSVVSRYVNYVLKEVFQEARHRKYQNPSEKWWVLAQCLEIFERCIFGFDISLIIDKLNVLYESIKKIQTQDGFGATSTPSSNQKIETVIEQINDELQMAIGHPGFLVLTYMLSDSSALSEIFSIIQDAKVGLLNCGTSFESETLNSLPTGPVEKQISTSLDAASVHSCVVRCLRILLRSFDLQRFFLDILADVIRKSAVANLGSSKLCHRLVKIDEILSRSNQKSTILRIVEYINSSGFEGESDDEIPLLSVKLLAVLSQSPCINNPVHGLHYGMYDDLAFNDTQISRANVPDSLVQILGESSKFSEILYGYVSKLDSFNFSPINWLEREQSLEMYMIKLNLDNGIGDPERSLSRYRYEDVDEFGNNGHQLSLPYNPSKLNEYIRLIIIDFLLHALKYRKSEYTISHLLLGLGKKNTWDSEWRSCLFSVIDILKHEPISLQHALSEEIQDIRSLPPSKLPICLSFPELYLRCLELIFLLASDEVTSTPTLRYLRSDEDLFYKLSYNLDSKIYCAWDWTEGTVGNADSHYISSFATEDSPSRNVGYAAFIKNQLLQRAWNLKIIALEMHTALINMEKRHAIRLVGPLFSLLHDEVGNFISSEFSSEDARFMKILVILEDTCSIRPSLKLEELPHSRIFPPHSFENFKFTDSDGLELYNVKKIFSHIEEDFEKYQKLRIIDSKHKYDQAVLDRDEIIRYFSKLNEVTSMNFARSRALSAWKELCLTVLNNVYDEFPAQVREIVLYAIMERILSQLQIEDLLPGDKECLAEVLLGCSDKLNRDKALFSISSPSLSLPLQYITNFFKQLCQILLMNGLNIICRGKLYASLLNILASCDFCGRNSQLAEQRTAGARTLVADANNGTSDINLDGKNSLFDKSTQDGIASKIQESTQAIMNKFLDRLLNVIAGDISAKNDESWRNVAMSTLESLVILSRRKHSKYTSSNDQILGYLKKRNFTTSFLKHLISEDDDALCQLLSDSASEADNGRLYLYESKMNLILRFSQTYKGAKMLVESSIFDFFEKFRFMRLRVDHKHDGPEKLERWIEMCSYVLKVCSSIAASFPYDDKGLIYGKIAKFIFNQRLFFTTVARMVLDSDSYITCAELNLMKEITAIMSIAANYKEVILDKDGNGLGGDLALLSLNMGLAYKFFSLDRWINALTPVTDDEFSMMNTPVDQGNAFNFYRGFLGSEHQLVIVNKFPVVGTEFGQKAMRKVGIMNRNVLSFFQIVSQYAELMPIFSLDHLSPMEPRRNGMGIIIGYIETLVKAVETSCRIWTNYQSAMSNVTELNSSDLDRLSRRNLLQSGGIIDINLHDQQLSALRALSSSMEDLALEITQYVTEIEYCLLICFRHFETSKAKETEDVHQSLISSLLKPLLGKLLQLNNDFIAKSYIFRGKFLLIPLLSGKIEKMIAIE